MRKLILLIAASLVIWLYFHVDDVRKILRPEHHVTKEVTLAEAIHILQTDQHKKTVILTASWCPACRKYMPTYIHTDVPSDALIYALSFDDNNNRLVDYANALGGNVIWLRIKDCDGGYCPNANIPLQNIGINYGGELPYLSVMDEQGMVMAEHVPPDYLSCIIKGKCIVRCENHACTITDLR